VYGAGSELYAVSSLGLIVAGAARPVAAGRYVTALDALRGEHYVARYDVATDGHAREIGAVHRVPSQELSQYAEREGAALIGPGLGLDFLPHARGAFLLAEDATSVDLDAWEPSYGRLAEAQVKWEAAHGRPLSPG